MKKRHYRDIDYWKQYNKFLPEAMQIKEDKMPEEKWWEWNGNSIHLDIMRNPKSKIKFILLHGGGGNGRLLSTFGVNLFESGYEYIAPDFPGFGLTIASEKDKKDYSIWIDIVSDLVDMESKNDNRPIILLGASIGGMLTYHVACKNNKVKGIIATCLADSRTVEARDALAKNKLWSRVGFFFTNIFSFLLTHINIRASWIAQMKQITNDPEFSKALIKDPLIGKSLMNMKFYKSMTDYNPLVEPEDFSNCPVLLAHGEKDLWTPYKISQEFFDKISGDKKFVLLEGASHYPYEEPGFSQMKLAIKEFINKIK